MANFLLDSNLALRPVLIRFNKGFSWVVRLVVWFKNSGTIQHVRSEEWNMKSLLTRSLLLAFTLSPAFLLGQDTASITGTVTDPTGAAVTNAQVTITSTEHGVTRTATANGSGDYLFAALPIGKYDLTVTAKGFKRYQAKGIVLDVGQKARDDVKLEVVLFLAIAAKDDALAVGGEERAAIVAARSVRELADVLAGSVHDE